MIAAGIIVVTVARAADDPPADDVVTRGASLFAREWLPVDSKGSGGDGLGPVYNETSCIACHNQGGPGGAGSTSNNVDILTVSSLVAGATELVDLHPGFKTSQSVAIHRFGIDPKYKLWRLAILFDDHVADAAQSAVDEIKQIQKLIDTRSSGIELAGWFRGGGMAVARRNPPALFGAGRIDAIPNDVLVAATKERFPDFPEVRGRVSVLKDARLGRFGWKAETSNLRDFVLSACANELGLEVPGHHQAASPVDPDAKPNGLDLTQQECDALVAYVRHLPAPTSQNSTGPREAPSVAEGRSLFEAAGCATCHRPRLGDVQGIYSDLLLHRMGAALAGAGSYYGESSKDAQTREEWRTPPLWGFRDSAPYLHDGRAGDLEEAVALHDGESVASAKRFFKLPPKDRLRIQAFLRSLAPPVVASR